MLLEELSKMSKKTPSQDLNCRIDAKQQDDWWFQDVADEVSGGESSIFRGTKINYKTWTTLLSS